MYLTGTAYNFRNRLHQLPTGLSDITNFKLEGSGYMSTWPEYEKRINSKEVKKKEFELLNLPNGGVNYFY